MYNSAGQWLPTLRPSQLTYSTSPTAHCYHLEDETVCPKLSRFHQLCRRLYLIDTLLALLRRNRTVLFRVCKVFLQSFDILPTKSLLSIIIIIIYTHNHHLVLLSPKADAYFTILHTVNRRVNLNTSVRVSRPCP